jgi:hypothetical protein
MDKRPSKWFLIRNPLLFQGWDRTKSYFEGWYFKIVDPSIPVATAVIPGIAMDENGEGHAFIQVMDGIACTASYHRWDIGLFQADPDTLDIQIGENRFFTGGISVNLDGFKADLQFSNLTPLPTSIRRPGIMGWYSYVPFMQCYHGLGSMHHKLSGSLVQGNRKHDLSDGTGYLEKDWGSSFPKAWIWSQCNTFNDFEDLSFFVSIAHIPWITGAFIGFLAAISIGGRVVVFATYTGAQRSTRIEGNSVLITLRQGGKVFDLIIEQAESAELRSPIRGEMTGKVNESMQASVTLNYKEEGGEELRANGKFAGLEAVGPVEVLLT